MSDFLGGSGINSGYYIEVITANGFKYIFNVIFGKEYYIYLEFEDISYVSRIHIVDSKMILFYLDGGVREFDDIIKSVRVVDNRDRKRHNINVEGNILKYNEEMAEKYNLPRNRVEKEYSSHYIKKRKR